jgi:hypothetical protein
MILALSADDLGPATEEAFDLVTQGDMWAVDTRLRQMLAGSHALHCMNIAIWLRVTSTFADDLPTWQPLLNQAVLICRQQGLPPEDVLYGMIPHNTVSNRNTEGYQ